MANYNVKEIMFDETTTYPADVWVPPNGKRVNMRNVHVAILNKTTGGVVVSIRILQGSMTRLVCLTAGPNEAECINIPLTVDVRTDHGDGAAPVIEIQDDGITSTKYTGVVTVVGEET